MIAFALSEEQESFRRLAHRFAAETIRPAARQADEAEEVPWPVLEKAHELGLTTYYLPERYGGGGVESAVTRALVDEEIFWGCAAVGTILGGTALAATPILLAGTEEQKMRFLSRFCEPGCPRLGAFALTEPSAGSDAASIVTQARRAGGKYVLSGYKHFITNAGIADLYVVFATVDVSLGDRGITAFIVEADRPGVVPGPPERKLGIRASVTASLALEEVEVPAENRLGEEGEGFKIAMRTFDLTRTHSPPAPSAWRGPPTSTPWTTLRSGCSSASPSCTTRPSPSPWPTWPRPSTPPGCSPGGPPGWPTRASPAPARPAWPNSLPPRSPCG